MKETMLATLSSSQVAEAMEANRLGFWKLFSQAPQVVWHEERGIVWFETEYVHDVFNRVLHLRFESGMLPRVAMQVIRHFQERRKPFLWQVGPTAQVDLELLLQDQGLLHQETEPVLAVGLRQFKEDVPTAAHLTIQPVTTAAQFEQWLRLWEVGSAEEVIQVWLALYTGLQLQPDSSLRFLLGTVDGTPVATSAVFVGAGVAGIECVSTLPDYRRQGIGAAMTLAALREARKQGYRVAVLTASPMGEPVYRRIGFQNAGTFSTYVWHPPEREG
jgi:ribosomal protein S18 acetylase RimI-like enzyme